MNEEKILYLDLRMGAAGDMLSGALYDLLTEEEKSTFLKMMEEIGLSGVSVHADAVLKSGIAGTQFHVFINGEEEAVEDVHPHDHEPRHEHGHHDHLHEHHHEHDNHDHLHKHHHEHDDHDHLHEHHHEHDDHDHLHEHHYEHDNHDHLHEHRHEHGDHEHDDHDHLHDHHHHHHHEHHSMEEIRSTILSLHLSQELKEQILSVYEKIALAESRVHGKPVSEVHLHEVGMKDAIADITSVCLLVSMIAPDRIVASPVTTGFGHVHCAHGILPVPAPATAILLEGLPVRSGDVEGELCTPTGAALVAQLVNQYGKMPEMRILRTGYGMGKKDFTTLNCVRAQLGTTGSDIVSTAFSTQNSGAVPQIGVIPDNHNEAKAVLTRGSDRAQDSIVELACNIDDMSGEEIGFAVERLHTEGAVDVWTQAIQMKKNRPGTILTVLCPEEDRERIISAIFHLTTTIGIRETLHRRYILSRRTEEVDTPYGQVHRKISEGYGVQRIKEEYEDLAAIARKKNCSLQEVRKELC